MPGRRRVCRELGWVAFDAANGICGTDTHVPLAVGLEYLGAAPLRGARRGGRGELLSVKVQVTQATQQAQN
jgi:transglutaminase-like putative cysteine protease